MAIIGGGPAGSTCSAFCASAGLRTLLIEREQFPREKVCGDCINPACWPVLEKLGIAERVFELPHATLDAVEFIAIGGALARVALPSGRYAEIAIKRSLFDHLLLVRAGECGVDVREKTIVTALSRVDRSPAASWKISTVAKVFRSRFLVAADGRNSTVARLLNLLPPAGKERVALQAHIPLPSGFGNRVVLQFLSEGYSGQAPVNNGELNVCLVSNATGMASLKAWAAERFGLVPNQMWRTITPLARAPLPPVSNGLFLTGDAARVVEPFTGEGIFYALRSGVLAAEAIVRIARGEDRESNEQKYALEHAKMYRGRLWINRAARRAVLAPRVASLFVHAARISPIVLRMLIGKIVR